MRTRFYLYRRGNTYYAEDSATRQRESLHTSDRQQAKRLVQAKNEATGKSKFNLAIAKAYLAEADPKLCGRTWEILIKEWCSRGGASTQARKERAMQNPVFDSLRAKALIETTSDDLHVVLGRGGVFSSHCLRCLHNLALGLGWLPWPIIPPKLWPPLPRQPKRAITLEEHTQIIESEGNEERKAYYQLLWEIGAGQSDAANLRADNIDWEKKTLRYQRMKTGEWACLSIGPRLEALLKRLPNEGPLFADVSRMPDKWRSSEFRRRCRILKMSGISLHSYRYAFAQRAKALGYPQRWAQNALGHDSRAVHQAYAKQGIAVCPSLEEYEQSVRNKVGSIAENAHHLKGR